MIGIHVTVEKKSSMDAKKGGKHNRNVEKVMIAARTHTIEPSSLG